ncbi:threonine/serine ThrE exporter family protein [Brachybacterium sp. DNPG3]
MSGEQNGAARRAEDSGTGGGTGGARSKPDAALSTATSPLGVPDSLTVRSEAAAAVGSELLASGMASYRVKAAMSRTARALDLDSFVSVVTASDITATATYGGRYRTRITQPSHVGVDVDHLYRTQRFVDALPASGTSAAEVYDELGRIRARGPLHSPLVNALAAGLACAAFSFLNAGGIVEILAVLVSATLGQAVRRRLQRRSWNQLLVTVIAAVITTALYLLLVGIPAAAGWIAPGHAAGHLSAVLFLVPGFPLITGLLDLVRGDYSAGIQRLAHAAVIIVGAASAVWTVALAAGVEAQPLAAAALPFAAMLGLRALATFIGVLGFAVLFNSPWRIALAAAGVSLVANSLRFSLTEAQIPDQIATLLATALVGAISYAIARSYHVPRPAISVPAVVIMIPGFAMYDGFAQVSSGDVVTGALQLQGAAQTVVAAAFGLALAHLATSPQWRHVEHPR